jgi:hypothetical protein
MVGIDMEFLPKKTPNLKSLIVTQQTVADIHMPALAKLKKLEYFAYGNVVFGQIQPGPTMKGLASLKKANPKVLINPMAEQLPLGPFNERLLEEAKKLNDDK